LHLSLVAAAGHVRCGAISGNEGGEATLDIVAQLVYDLTNAVVVIDSTAAIA